MNSTSLRITSCSAALLLGFLICGCAGPNSNSSTSLAAVSPQDDPDVYENEQGQTVADFNALPEDSKESLAYLSERFNVTAFELDADQDLKSVSIRLSDASNVPWQTAVLAELVLSPGATVFSWVEGEAAASDCQLHAEIGTGGTIRLWCEGDCPPEFPVCSIVTVQLPGGGTRFVCLCKKQVVPVEE